MFKRNTYDAGDESLENVIIQLYKDTINSTKKPVRIKKSDASPYLQKIAPQKFSLHSKPPASGRAMKRPSSAFPHGNSKSNAHHLTRHSNEVESEDENASKAGSQNLNSSFLRRKRPASAHLPLSRNSVKGDLESIKSADLAKPIHKRKMITITCKAFVNGTYEYGAKLVESNIKQLLQAATVKLGLTMAARRIFLFDGTEVFRPQDVPKDSEVFISMGEAFKNPFDSLKVAKKRKGKGFTSKRLKRLVGKKPRRIMVFLNGDGSEAHEIVDIVENQDDDYKTSDAYKAMDKTQAKAEDAARTEAKERGDNKFLDACTGKLNLNSAAKVWYDWTGTQIKRKDIEGLDHLVVPAPTIYGPLWISRGEGFNPSGAQQFIEKVVEKLRSEIKELKKKRKTLREERDKKLEEDYYLDDSDFSSDDESSKKTSNDDTALNAIEVEIENLREVLKKYKTRLVDVEEKAETHAYDGSSHMFSHIQKIDADDPKLGRHGLRLRIYDNGSDSCYRDVHVNMRNIQRGAKNSNELSWFRFLEQLTTWHRPKNGTGAARSLLIRRLFDENGNEITDIKNIKNDQNIWVTYGEDFKPYAVRIVSIALDKVSVQYQGDEVTGIYKDMYDERDFPKSYLSLKQWSVVDGIPKLSNEQRHSDSQKPSRTSQFATTDVYLQNREDSNLLMHPNLQVVERGQISWLQGVKTWIFDQNGQISSRAFPKLALSVEVKCPLRVSFEDGSTMEGYTVKMDKKCKENNNQRWSFTSSANICSLHEAPCETQQVLTFINSDDVEKYEIFNQESHEYEESTYMEISRTNIVIVTNKLKSYDKKAISQRWAIKQEGSIHEARWRQTKVSNLAWRKMGYSWPVLPDGNWNDDYEWPMEGGLIANAPSTKKQKREGDEDNSVRLQVYRNGETNKNRFAYLVAPDLSSMEKEAKQKKPNKGKFQNVEEKALLKKKWVEEVELKFFFEKATTALDLRFAARRLFTAKGEEIFDLRSLKRDDVVFVSCGEGWLDPNVSKQEQQRKKILAKLSHDVSMISSFCQLRQPADLVIELETGATLGSRLVARRSKIKEKAKRNEEVADEPATEENVEEGDEEDKKEQDVFEEVNFRTAHEQAHYKQNKNYQHKYAWQLEEEQQDDFDHVTEEDTYFSEEKSQNSKKSTRKPRSSNQCFEFEGGFIHPRSDPDLVLGVSGMNLDNIAGSVEVVLCRRSVDDPVQQWELTEDNIIRLKCSKKLVLGVSLPLIDGDENVDLKGSVITLQALKPYNFGRAHQKFSWNEATKQISLFQSTIMDKEVTAANYVSICTYAVIGNVRVNQAGFTTQSRYNGDRLTVCSSCAKIMRSQVLLTKASESASFVCAMGEAKKRGMRQYGSFTCLNGKVDLSTHEANSTLQHWRQQLTKLRQETSFRLLNQELNAVTSPTQTCRVLARRNGDSRKNDGELVIGSSISGLLEQCTQRLGLGAAARRLYTNNGMQVLHMEQLVQFAIETFNEIADAEIEGGEGEPGECDENTESSSKENSTRKRRTSAKDKKTKKQTPLPVILRKPIEVWVSCGENFISPEKTKRNLQLMTNQRNEKCDEALHLETEKHVLRHMTGRRMTKMNPVELKTTKNTQQPVLVEGGWQEMTRPEVDKMEVVHKLEEQISGIQPTRHTRPKSKGVDMNRSLYRQSNRKRVIVYANGESMRRTVYVWGESIDELLNDATFRLNLIRPARRLYNEQGDRVMNFDSIDRDAVLCVTCGEALKGRPKQSNVQMKAKWARARKELGDQVAEHVLEPTLVARKTRRDFSSAANTIPRSSPGVAWT